MLRGHCAPRVMCLSIDQLIHLGDWAFKRFKLSWRTFVTGERSWGIFTSWSVAWSTSCSTFASWRARESCASFIASGILSPLVPEWIVPSRCWAKINSYSLKWLLLEQGEKWPLIVWQRFRYSMCQIAVHLLTLWPEFEKSGKLRMRMWGGHG